MEQDKAAVKKDDLQVFMWKYNCWRVKCSADSLSGRKRLDIAKERVNEAEYEMGCLRRYKS